MTDVVERLSDWLAGELRALPETIRALYVEFSEVYSPDMSMTIAFGGFGFKDALPDDLGMFCWETTRECVFDPRKFPDVDWLKDLKETANIPPVRALLEQRNLYFAVACHDEEVSILRRAK